MQIHAACVALDDHGVLLRGPSGAGKSDLALRLIDAGGVLVADDRVDLAARDGQVYASAPAALAGMLEVRGVGLMRVAYLGEARLALAIDLVAAVDVERLPQATTAELAGCAIATLALDPFEASAVAKVKIALAGAMAT